MPATRQPTLRRNLGVHDGIAILVGITIGAGIYSTPQIIAGYLDSFLLISLLWLVGGVFAFLGGLVYAELGTRLPDTGGEYVYINRAFGPFAGFLFGWSQLLIIRTSPAAGLSIIAANYIGYFVDLSGWRHTATAIGIIVVLGAINYSGVQVAAWFQKLSTAVKLAGIFALAGLGVGLMLAGWDPDLPPTDPVSLPVNASSLTAVMMLIVFSYLGWDRVGYVAGEMKSPRKVVPLSMFYGLGAVILSYLCLNWLYYQTLGLEGMRNSTVVASDTAVRLLGPVGAGLVSLLVIVSAIGSTNGTMMTASRVYYAMARDRIFFRWMDHIHPRFRTPSRAIVAHCVWGTVILLARQNFETIVAGMAFAVLIFYGFTTVALFRFRRSGTGTGHYSMPGYPWLPGLYLAGIIVLTGTRLITDFTSSLFDLAFIASGLPFALYWVRKGNRS